jgi:mono/diheme cytochrome c family protein
MIESMKTVGIVVAAAFCVALSGMSAAENAERLYLEKCATCHAADGSGHTVAANKMTVPDLRSKRVRQTSDEDLYAATAQGKGHTSYPHAFLHKGLTEQQIHDLVKYIRTFVASQN